MTDPFAPLSAKPKSDEERRLRRIKEAASSGGKKRRGIGAFIRPLRFNNEPRLKPTTEETTP